MKPNVVLSLLLTSALIFFAVDRSYGQNSSGNADASPSSVVDPEGNVIQPAVTAPALVPPPNSIVDDYANLNRAFILSPDDCAKAIAKGQDLAKKGKPFSDVVKNVTEQPRGVRGEKGISHESCVYTYSLNGANLAVESYQAAISYTPLNIPPSYNTNGAYCKKLQFVVQLMSSEKFTGFGMNRTAAPEDVIVNKFVLTDDQGNAYNSQEVDGGQITSNGYNWPQFYKANYVVAFDLFDSNGKPLIKNDVKKITLHILKPYGEEQVDYDLKPPHF